MNIVGFILSRNNGNLIEKAIKKCPQCINQIFISDDKSTDKTHEVAKKNGIEIFTNEKINGYGGNVKNALKVAFEKFDADLSELTMQEAVLRSTFAYAVSGKAWAVQFIADRMEGKPVMKMQVESHEPIQLLRTGIDEIDNPDV